MAPIPTTLGKYQVLQLLGRGGMGEVYKAFQPDLNRHVAVKVLLAGAHAPPDFLERFQREASMAARLVHPSIVQVHDIGTEGRVHYIVMEYVEGRSLKEILLDGKLDPEKALKIGASVARALQFAHERQIIHRDVKPGNILIDRQGRVRILDFGLAKSLADGKGPTLSSTMIGTPCYMSPEQAFGAPEEVDARTDVYSLGALLYEMLTGRPPFEGPTVLAILRKIEDEEPAPPGASPAVDALILKALSKDRDRRFASAGEMAEALKALLAGGAAEPSGMRIPTLRLFRARPRAAWGALAAALLGFALVVWGVWPAERPAAPAPDPHAEIRELLAEAGRAATDDELQNYRKNPELRALAARQRLKRGQYSRAVDDLEGYERMVYELASVRGLQRFVSPALFRLYLKEPPGLKKAEAFLASAIARHLEGRQEAAREKLKFAAAGGAPKGHALLVRAHMDLWDVFPDPASEVNRPVLEALRGALESQREPYLLSVRAIAAHLMGGDEDRKAAWDLSEELLRKSPHAAETILLRMILFQRDGKVEQVADLMDDLVRAEPDLDVSAHRMYLDFTRWVEARGAEPPDLKSMRARLDERLKREHYPAALFLRGVLHALESRWAEAQADLAKLERRTPLDRVTVHPPLLAPLVYGGIGTLTELMVAARDLQQQLGRGDAARATAEAITGEDVPDDEQRRGVLRANHRFLAAAFAGDESRVLAHLEEALKLGTPAQELRDDESLGALREKPGFEEMLKKYE